jgi:hypothetical protein
MSFATLGALVLNRRSSTRSALVMGRRTPSTCSTSTALDIFCSSVNWFRCGKLGHLQGHQNDGFDVANVDFSGHIRSATGASFDSVADGVAGKV